MGITFVVEIDGFNCVRKEEEESNLLKCQEDDVLYDEVVHKACEINVYDVVISEINIVTLSKTIPVCRN